MRFYILFLFATLVASSLSSEEVQWKSCYKKVLVSAYCPCEICCSKKFSDGLTATGTDAHIKGVAVDPKLIPLNSRIDVPGYGNWILADDIGGAIEGCHIDIRFKTHQEAINWGVKTLKIRVWTKIVGVYKK